MVQQLPFTVPFCCKGTLQETGFLSHTLLSVSECPLACDSRLPWTTDALGRHTAGIQICALTLGAVGFNS